MRSIAVAFLTSNLVLALGSGLSAQTLHRTAHEPPESGHLSFTGSDMTGEVLAERVGERLWVVAVDALTDSATGDGEVDQVVVFTSSEPIEVPTNLSGFAILHAEEAGFVLTIPSLGTTYDVVLRGQPPLTRLPEHAGAARIDTGVALQYWKPGDQPRTLPQAVRLHSQSLRPRIGGIFQKDPDPHSDSGCGTSCNISCLDGTSCSINCNTTETALCATCKCDPFAMCKCKSS